MDGVQAQFFEQKDVFDQSELDYEKIFKEGLSANGKTLNLSGKKIGDKGVEILLSKDFLKKVTKLDLRYNKISEKGAKLMAADVESFGSKPAMAPSMIAASRTERVSGPA